MTGRAQLAMVLPMRRVQSSQLPRCRTGRIASASSDSSHTIKRIAWCLRMQALLAHQDRSTWQGLPRTGMSSLVFLIRSLRQDLQICDAEGQNAERCASEEGGEAQGSNGKDDISPQR